MSMIMECIGMKGFTSSELKKKPNSLNHTISKSTYREDLKLHRPCEKVDFTLKLLIFRVY